MTTLASESIDRHATLIARLAQLRAARDQALSETIPEMNGDAADRATNVDAHARLELLESRIATVERELAEGPRPGQRKQKDTVTVGDVVTLDLGDGPEPLLFAPAGLAPDGLDVVTPDSPLGRALAGVRVGATVSYAPGAGRVAHTATVLAVS